MTVARQDVERQGERQATDAVTLGFSDPGAQLHGVFRLALDPDGHGSAFAVLFRGREPVAAQAAGELAVDGADWSALEAGGLRMEVVEPLERWRMRWRGGDAEAELDVAAASAPAAMSPVGGMSGYEQLCTVTGTVRLGSEPIAVRADGQRGHLWGTPDWRDLELTRSIGVWLGDGDGIALATARPGGARGHDEEERWGALVSGGEPVAVADPRLSTAYDGDGRQRRAGLELWVSDEDGYPQRASGEVLCGSTLDLGPLRLDVAFFTWRVQGREAVGRYDVLRRA